MGAEKSTHILHQSDENTGRLILNRTGRYEEYKFLALKDIMRLTRCNKYNMGTKSDLKLAPRKRKDVCNQCLKNS